MAVTVRWTGSGAGTSGSFSSLSRSSAANAAKSDVGVSGTVGLSVPAITARPRHACNTSVRVLVASRVNDPFDKKKKRKRVTKYFFLRLASSIYSPSATARASLLHVTLVNAVNAQRARLTRHVISCSQIRRRYRRSSSGTSTKQKQRMLRSLRFHFENIAACSQKNNAFLFLPLLLFFFQSNKIKSRGTKKKRNAMRSHSSRKKENRFRQRHHEQLSRGAAFFDHES